MAKSTLLVPIVKIKRLEYAPEIGSLLHWPGDGSWWEPGMNGAKPTYEMVEARNFTARLTCDQMRSGRSAKYVIWQDAEGRTFPMFITDLVKALPYIQGGVLETEFTFCKRGQNYGIRVFGTQTQDQKSA